MSVERIAEELEADEWNPAPWVLGMFVAIALMLGLIAEGGRITELEAKLANEKYARECLDCRIGELEADLEWDGKAIGAIRDRLTRTQRRLAGPDVFPEAYTLEENGEFANRGEPWQQIPRRESLQDSKPSSD